MKKETEKKEKEIKKEEKEKEVKKNENKSKEREVKKKSEHKFKINKEKIIEGTVVVLIIAAILGFAYWTSISYGGVGYNFTEIDIDKYIEYLADDEKRIIYISRPTCPHCVRETPILKRVAAKNDLTIYYLNTVDFYDDSIQDYTEDGYKLMNSTAEFSEGIGTPNILIVQNGKVVDRIEGEAPSEDLTSLFERNGFIK